ncbi:hypothetical protein [Prosthecochloris sp. GSB1]|uniref:hypothetical protein n=1 Tax=Prosthecochloris sp. GSB1 TaxID=281093 RepID=UPI0012374501|nr:hypothetical protein [Prosthecochloris sp. GSB1]
MTAASTSSPSGKRIHSKSLPKKRTHCTPDMKSKRRSRQTHVKNTGKEDQIGEENGARRKKPVESSKGAAFATPLPSLTTDRKITRKHGSSYLNTSNTNLTSSPKHQSAVKQLQAATLT